MDRAPDYAAYYWRLLVRVSSNRREKQRESQWDSRFLMCA